MTRLVDSHCHLDSAPFAKDADAAIARARLVGVEHFLVVGTSLSTAARTASFVRGRSGFSCTVGTHPHHAAEESPSVGDLIAAARRHGAVGLGETGLDFNRNRTPAEVQKENFRRHVEAALALDLPLVVHTRDADAQTVALLDEADPGRRLRGVLHCFDSGRELAEAAFSRGLHLSFSGILTYKRSVDLRAIAGASPRDRVLLETDCPYLSPEPVRGMRRNEPSNLVHTAAVLAQAWNVSLEAAAEATTENFLRLFSAADAREASADGMSAPVTA